MMVSVLVSVWVLVSSFFSLCHWSVHLPSSTYMCGMIRVCNCWHNSVYSTQCVCVVKTAYPHSVLCYYFPLLLVLVLVFLLLFVFVVLFLCIFCRPTNNSIPDPDPFLRARLWHTFLAVIGCVVFSHPRDPHIVVSALRENCEASS